jgi:hypothetical protein
MGILSKLIAFQMQAKALTAKEVVIESNQIRQSFEKWHQDEDLPLICFAHSCSTTTKQKST